MEISKLRDIQPDRERSKAVPSPRRDRRAPSRKAIRDTPAPSSPDADSQPPAEPTHRIDVTA